MGAGSAASGAGGTGPELGVPFAPDVGKTALLIGQSGRRAHVDYVLGTASMPAGGSVYAELYSGKLLSFEQEAFVDYLAREAPGALVEVGLSWKDNRVNAGYCDLADAACLARGGAVDPELDIVAGKYDPALQSFAALLKSNTQLKFLLRVDYEVSPNLHCRPSDETDCPAYVNAFAHIKKTLQQAGASNVAFVFHPTRGWAKQLYPGPELTDWIAFSVFNHDLCLPTPEGTNGGCTPGAHLDQNLARDLAWAAEQGKPILIAESTVQQPSSASAAGFNEYLSRLLELVNLYPQVRGLTYINMKWAGGWIYGEDWTSGAFGNVDARLSRFPETRAYFCAQLALGRFVGLGGAMLGCDQAVPTFERPLPTDLDAPAYERLIALGNNRCVRMAAGSDAAGSSLSPSECAELSGNGEARLHVAEAPGGTHLFGDVSWLCWSAEGERVVERACADDPAQRFRLEELQTTPRYRELRIESYDGRCLASAGNDAPFALLPCGDAPEQTFRL
ncbi:MAG TPA: hypothetical protein VHB79_20975 [Polyangiaceae bacterium]|nr:hypothetical protein [Polyangiaceae bacterium]